MKASTFGLCLLGMASASAVIPRNEDDPQYFHALSKDPHFFSLVVQNCDVIRTEPFTPTVWPSCDDPTYDPEVDGICDGCLLNYAIILDEGTVIATMYTEDIAGHLPTFFVDDDSRMYSVSKRPLEFYVDENTGLLRYSRVGWTPPVAMSVGFHHMGTNPIGVSPSPSILSWPSTPGVSFDGTWYFCPYGDSGQFQVIANYKNFGDNIGPGGLRLRIEDCWEATLSAINSNPWKATKAPISDVVAGTLDDDWKAAQPKN